MVISFPLSLMQTEPGLLLSLFFFFPLNFDFCFAIFRRNRKTSHMALKGTAHFLATVEQPRPLALASTFKSE